MTDIRPDGLEVRARNRFTTHDAAITEKGLSHPLVDDNLRLTPGANEDETIVLGADHSRTKLADRAEILESTIPWVVL